MNQTLDRAVIPNPFRTLVLRTLTKFAGTDAKLTDCAEEICEAATTDKDDKIDALRTELAAANSELRKMKILLCEAAYPRRGAPEENQTILQFAQKVQKLISHAEAVDL